MQMQICVDNIYDDSCSKTIFLVRTRAKTREIEEKNKVYKPGETNKIEFHYIEEKNNFITKLDSYNHIFYGFENLNCRLHKQIQYKMKTIIEIENLDYGELYQLTENHSVIKLPININNECDEENVRISLNVIIAFCVDRHFENIALNLDVNNPNTYLKLKKSIRNMFSQTNIKITLYLNKVIELTDIDQIQQTLTEFHDTLLGGHASYERMFNNIRRFYYWPSMKKDIKNYTRTCEICQKTKIVRHNHQPIMISSTPSTVFPHYLSII